MEKFFNNLILFSAFLIILFVIIFYKNKSYTNVIPSSPTVGIQVSSASGAIQNCNKGTLTKVKLECKDNVGACLLENWSFCFGNNCMRAIDYLNLCNGKRVSIEGKLTVDKVCPSCVPSCPCTLIPDLNGITPHGISDQLQLKYKDKNILVKGVLNWDDPQHYPTIDVEELN